MNNDTNDFILYTLGNYLQQYRNWSDHPPEAQKVLIYLGQLVMAEKMTANKNTNIVGGDTFSASHEKQQFDVFDDYWTAQIKIAEDGKNLFNRQNQKVDGIVTSLQQDLQEQENVLRNIMGLFENAGGFSIFVWQDLVASYRNEKNDIESQNPVKKTLFPLGRGATLTKTKKELKFLQETTSTTMTTREVSGKLKDLDRSLSLYDARADKIYKNVDTAFWSFRRIKSHTHQYGLLSNHVTRMRHYLKHTLSQLVENSIGFEPNQRYTYAYGVMQFGNYFDNDNWSSLPEVMIFLDTISEDVKQKLVFDLNSRMLHHDILS